MRESELFYDYAWVALLVYFMEVGGLLALLFEGVLGGRANSTGKKAHIGVLHVGMYLPASYDEQDLLVRT